MKLRRLPVFVALVLPLAALPLRGADAVKPLKVLLITGGCCHDYAKQKEILRVGLEERANVIVDEVYSGDKTDAPAFPMIYGNPNYAKGYDVIIHDECASRTSGLTTKAENEAVVKSILKPHREDGIPGVNLHCGVHAYRMQDSPWFEYLGLESRLHDAQEPIAVSYTDKEHPITKGLADWTTIKEEHYNNVKIFDTAHALAHGKQTVHVKQKNPDGTVTITGDRTDDWVDVWTNLYNGKTRVFSTTIGHNTETVADPRYLDLVTRGLLWATGHLNDDGTPAPGYGPGGK
jgi:type 1 glutamine amidotransferase